MKELFRERDIIHVNHDKALLAKCGIPSLIRNECLTAAGLSEIPTPIVRPTSKVYSTHDTHVSDAQRRRAGI